MLRACPAASRSPDADTLRKMLPKWLRLRRRRQNVTEHLELRERPLLSVATRQHTGLSRSTWRNNGGTRIRALG